MGPSVAWRPRPPSPLHMEALKQSEPPHMEALKQSEPPRPPRGRDQLEAVGTSAAPLKLQALARLGGAAR